MPTTYPPLRSMLIATSDDVVYRIASTSEVTSLEVLVGDRVVEECPSIEFDHTELRPGVALEWQELAMDGAVYPRTTALIRTIDVV